MKKLLLLTTTLLLSTSAFAWNPWSVWYPSIGQAQHAAIASCQAHYGYSCVIHECQKRYYNYIYEWRCAAQKAYQAPSHYNSPPNYNHNGY